MSHINTTNTDIEIARMRWLKASEVASNLTSELFQVGDGYGDPEARSADEHRLQSARAEVERLFREYYDLDRRNIELEMIKLQRSQQLATWASFFVAVVVGLATVVSTFIALLN